MVGSSNFEDGLTNGASVRLYELERNAIADDSFPGQLSSTGPLALVQSGDEVELDVPGRQIELKVDAEKLARRRAKFEPPAPKYERGYGRMFLDHVTQANLGCDFDFLRK